MGEIVAGSRVMVRLEAEAEDHEWPEGCASFADVFGDADAAEPDDGFEAGTVIRLDEDGAEPIALVVWDGLADCAEDADGDGMPSVWAWRVPLFALMPHGSCRSRFEALVEPVRQIATAIGTPAHVDPLADLPAEAVGEIERLRAHNARMVAELLLLADACDKAKGIYGSRWGENGGAEDVACALPGDSWAETGAALRDLANDLPPIHDSDAMTAWEASRRLAAGEVDDG